MTLRKLHTKEHYYHLNNMYKNLIIPYSSTEIHPTFEIVNDKNLIIKNDNSIDLITDKYKYNKNYLDIKIKLNIPPNIDYFIEEHENEKNALKCSVRIESRYSVIRKPFDLERIKNTFEGIIKIELKNYSKQIELTPFIYRTKKLNKIKSYTIASDQGSIIGFCDKPLTINLDEKIPSDFRVEWKYFNLPEFKLDEAYHNNFYWLQIQDPRDNNPTLWLNKNYKDYDKTIFDTNKTKGLSFQNKKLFETNLYHDVMGKLLYSVLNKLIIIQANYDKDNDDDKGNAPETVSLDDLEYKWEKAALKLFSRYLIIDARTKNEALEEIFSLIKENKHDDLISQIDLAVHLKEKTFKDLESYYNFILAEEN